MLISPGGLLPVDLKRSGCSLSAPIRSWFAYSVSRSAITILASFLTATSGFLRKHLTNRRWLHNDDKRIDHRPFTALSKVWNIYILKCMATVLGFVDFYLAIVLVATILYCIAVPRLGHSRDVRREKGG